MVAAPMSPRAVETTCGSLLRELQHIWDEVGENDMERDKMLLQLEQECLEVYRRKVDQANHARARLHQSLADAEAELASLFSALGDRPNIIEKRQGSLKEQIAAIAPQIEELRLRREDREKQFKEIKVQIQKISTEISEKSQAEAWASVEEDLSLRRLEDYHSQLHCLQKEKSDRLHKVLEYVNTVHELCSVLRLDFFKTVTEVHPSLDESSNGQSKSISDETFARLNKTIQNLQDEKRRRLKKLQDLGASLIEMWNLMDTPLEEREAYEGVTSNIITVGYEITSPGALALDMIEEAELEVERLSELKASKMKELVLKKHTELEDICKRAHMECDASMTQEKITALFDSGVVDPCELLSSIEQQIVKAREDALSRKEIMEKMEKWMAACEEETWLEDYMKDENRYNSTRGAHINLKRAERARVAVNKLPALVEGLSAKTKSWEEEQGTPFLYDGVRLLAMLEEYNLLRQEREEEKRRLRDQKRLQEQILNEQETLFGSRPSPNKTGGPKKNSGGLRPNANPGNRRLSLGPELLTPRVNGITPSRLVTKENKSDKLRPAVVHNFVALAKDETHLSSARSPDTSSPIAV